MDNLIKSIRRTGLLIMIGLAVIIYAGLGFTYFQQGMEQEGLDEEVKQLTRWVANPLPPDEDLQAEYDEATRAMAPMAVLDIIAMIVDIARERGIDVSPDGGKFTIPSPSSPVPKKVGAGEYQVLVISNIEVEGEYSRVIGFISDLGSDKELKNLVLENLAITYTAGSKEASANTTVNISATLDVNFYTQPEGKEKKG
ncbi:hypothetical protein ACFLUO_09670 [Chloroflexota bacterium]